MLQAVRDNPQRVASIGYDPQRVRYLAMLLTGQASIRDVILFPLMRPE